MFAIPAMYLEMALQRMYETDGSGITLVNITIK